MKDEKFIAYSSVKLLSRKGFLEQAEYIVPKNEKWCVMEKLHGASVQIYYDKDGFKYGNRSSFIKGSFMNAHNVLPKYKEKIKAIFDEVNKNRKIKDLPIRIYGEIYGGLWNNKTLELRVQKKIQYSEYITVVFFDMMIGDEMIAYKEAIEILKKHSIPYLEPLKICSLKEAFEYPNDFNSLIPALNGLPIVENNTCEGTVIKPFEGEYKTNGDSRIILKNKNKKFSEKKNRIKIEVKELSEEANELISILESYITENRMDAVISKQEFGKKDFGMFIAKFAKDVLGDAENDEVNLNSVDKREMSRINKLMNKKIVEVCKDLFFKKFKI